LKKSLFYDAPSEKHQITAMLLVCVRFVPDELHTTYTILVKE